MGQHRPVEAPSSSPPPPYTGGRGFIFAIPAWKFLGSRTSSALLAFAISALLAFWHPAVAAAGRIVAGDLTLTLDSTGQIVGLENNSVVPNVDHSLPTKRSPLVSFTVESSATFVGSSSGTTAHRKPKSWTYAATTSTLATDEIKKGDYTFQFDDRISAVVEVVEKQGYATLSLKSIANPSNKDIRNVIWGPLIVDIVELVGDLVGVASNRDFAVGMFGTNPKTTGGWPYEYRDIGHRAEVINIPGEFSRSGRFWYEISAARHHSFGTVIQAYTRSYTVERIISSWGWKPFALRPVPALTGPNADYGTLTGSKVAVFGVARREGTDWWLSKRDAMADQVLTRIGDIEIGESMPHPILGGIWGKKSQKANQPYVIVNGLNNGNINHAAQFASSVGFESIYANATWGVFDTHGGSYRFKTNLGGTNSNPDLRFREVANLIKNQYHVGLGTHTLSNWIAPSDRIAQAGRADLAYGAVGKLRESLTASANSLKLEPLRPSIAVGSLTSGWYGFHEPALSGHPIDKTLLVGNEIIEYRGFDKSTESAGYISLTGLRRGMYGSRAGWNGVGVPVRKLIGYGYGHTFNAGFDMGINRIAGRLADVIDLGIADFSFDGTESALLTHDALGLAAFVDKVYDSLEDKNDFINDSAIAVPYNWHIHSRYNWGELANNILRAHQHYRWSNQVYFARNYLPPMMGWWNIDEMDEWRWGLSKSASFHGAGFAFWNEHGSSGFTRYTHQNRVEILNWRRAILADSFDEYNKFLMREADEYFKLDKKVEQSGHFGPTWKLSDWVPRTSTASNSRYIAPQMVGHPLVNLARDALVTTSSRKDVGHNAGMIVDNFTGVGVPAILDHFAFDHILGTGEWVASQSDLLPWVQLTWERPRKIRRILIFDRENTDHIVTNANIVFSDGSTIRIPSHPADGDAVSVDFPQKTVEWLRYTIRSGRGHLLGVSEIAVFGPSAWYERCNLTRGATVMGASVGSDNSKIIDGNFDDANAVLLSGNSATIDLQREHLISGLAVWRKYSDERIYSNVVFEISENAQFSDSIVVFNNDGDNSLSKGVGMDAEYKETAAGKMVMFTPVKGRYVRVWASGNSVNGNRHLIEVEVYGVVSGIGSGASASTRSDLAAPLAIDSDLDTEVALGAGAQYLQIDLGETKKINSLAVFRGEQAERLRTYKGLIYQISTSSSFPANSTTTVFNNDYKDTHGLGLSNSDGEFFESQNGHFVRFPPVQGRYLRLYSDGSHEDEDDNTIKEVLVGTDE